VRVVKGEGDGLLVPEDPGAADLGVLGQLGGGLSGFWWGLVGVGWNRWDFDWVCIISAVQAEEFNAPSSSFVFATRARDGRRPEALTCSVSHCAGCDPCFDSMRIFGGERDIKMDGKRLAEQSRCREVDSAEGWWALVGGRPYFSDQTHVYTLKQQVVGRDIKVAC
jgi:hypothetical protein